MRTGGYVASMSLKGSFHRRAGLSLVELMMGAAAAAGLVLLVARVVQDSTKSQADLGFVGTATELESRFRAATLSSSALVKTKNANMDMADCVAMSKPQCQAVGELEDFELRSAADKVLVPSPPADGVPVYVNDNGDACNHATEAGCRWRVSAQYTPRDAKGQIVALTMKIDWEKPLVPVGNTESVVMKTRTVNADVPKVLFADAAGDGSCDVCDPNYQIISAMNESGCPVCVPNPLLPMLQDYVCGPNQVLESVDILNQNKKCVDLP